MSEQKKHRYPLAVRLTCIILAVLVTGSALAFIGWMILNLLAK